LANAEHRNDPDRIIESRHIDGFWQTIRIKHTVVRCCERVPNNPRGTLFTIRSDAHLSQCC
jgi:hypothetical protein